jgi:hypothetical protein
LAALGYGGQYLFVVPEQKIVAVFTGWNIYDSRPDLVQAFEDYVLRSVVQ